MSIYSHPAARVVRDAADAAVPGAEAAPEAALATAVPGPGLTPDQGPSPGARGEASQSLPPDSVPAQSPSPSPGVEPRHPTWVRSPGPGPRAGPNLQRIMAQSLNPIPGTRR